MSVLSDVGSAAAFVVSAYSLYQTTLKRAAIKVFVSPVIRYASPYQNSNFEAFAVPVTLTNEGARTGLIVSMDLQVRAPERDVIKRFYSADVGQWSIEKNRTGDFRPFAPIVLAGRTSHTETIIFHARRDEPVMQIVDKEGPYQFMLTMQTTLEEGFGFLNRLRQKPPKPLLFDMVLPALDHRAFTSGSGTLPLHHKNFQTSVSAT
jgi:hypothetical protein